MPIARRSTPCVPLLRVQLLMSHHMSHASLHHAQHPTPWSHVTRVSSARVTPPRTAFDTLVTRHSRVERT
eukprot:354838-Chlamydomonas_euryale.AAC.1